MLLDRAEQKITLDRPMGSNDRDEEFPLFSLQQLYPNIRYVFGIFDIVPCCSNPK